MFVRTVLAIAGFTLALSVLSGDAALAGRPGGGGSSSSSISLVVLNAGEPASLEVGARFGDQVTFNVSTTATATPYVNLKCYQNGVLVAEGWEGFFDGALGDEIFTLWSPMWTGGSADCTAALAMYGKRRWTILASVAFHVSP